MTYCSTPRAIVWTVAAQCPRCGQPLVLRHNHEYRHVVVCLGAPRCGFVSAYSQLVHALLDHIVMLRDRLAELGHPVEEALP